MPIFYIGYGIAFILSVFSVIKFKDKFLFIMFILSGTILFSSVFFPYLQFSNIVINFMQLLFIYMLIIIFVYFLKFELVDFFILIVSSSMFYYFIISGYDGFFSDTFFIVFLLLFVNIISNAKILKSLLLLLSNGFVLYVLKFMSEYDDFGFVFVSFDELFSLIVYFVVIEIIFYSFVNLNNVRWGYEKKFCNVFNSLSY